MTNRPDFSVMLMAAFAILVAVISGAVAGSYGLPTDMKMLAANFGFAICCYVTTFRFSGVLGQNLFEDFLKNKSNQLIDVSGLFDGGNPARTARAEKIWDNKPVSQCVLIKTYAADTKTVFDRIVNNLCFRTICSARSNCYQCPGMELENDRTRSNKFIIRHPLLRF